MTPAERAAWRTRAEGEVIRLLLRYRACRLCGFPRRQAAWWAVRP